VSQNIRAEIISRNSPSHKRWNTEATGNILGFLETRVDCGYHLEDGTGDGLPLSVWASQERIDGDES